MKKIIQALAGRMARKGGKFLSIYSKVSPLLVPLLALLYFLVDRFKWLPMNQAFPLFMLLFILFLISAISHKQAVILLLTEEIDLDGYEYYAEKIPNRYYFSSQRGKKLLARMSLARYRGQEEVLANLFEEFQSSKVKLADKELYQALFGFYLRRPQHGEQALKNLEEAFLMSRMNKRNPYLVKELLDVNQAIYDLEDKGVPNDFFEQCFAKNRLQRDYNLYYSMLHYRNLGQLEEASRLAQELSHENEGLAIVQKAKAFLEIAG